MQLQHISQQLISIGADLVSLLYPRVCSGCDKHLMKHEENLCLVCLHGLPRTYFWDYDVSPVEKLFWGKIPVHGACSFLHFEKDSVVQELMHRLKYDGRTGVGTQLGVEFGNILKEKELFQDANYIIPIPLHRTKELRRGFNQSQFIADGLSNALQIPVRSDLLSRIVPSDSQTRKSRFDRSENVRDIFKTHRKEMLSGKNIILVDDVVTTGATLEAAGSQLVSAGINKLYIATLAIA